MNKYWQYLCSYTLATTTAFFPFLPEAIFSIAHSWDYLSDYWGYTINKVIFLLLIGIIWGIVLFIIRIFRKKITIKGHNFKVIVEYGDLLKQKRCKKVISYITEVGDAINQIKPTSLCGQFLQNHRVNIFSLLSNNNLKPERRRSEYNGQICYEAGTLLPYDEFLLMAFGKLDKNGRAVMSREEYLSCLSNFWKDIDKYYAQKDVAILLIKLGKTYKLIIENKDSMIK